jgi:hypothetical protein
MNGVADPSMAAVSARKVCARLHKAYRDHRLYPAGHPTSRNNLELMTAMVASLLNSCGPLTLQVTEDRILLEGEEVYSHAESRDNLAFLMFRDGITGITFIPGVDQNELEALVDCLARADQMQNTDYDLSTALWEHDLIHISLEVVDPFLEGDGSADGSFYELRETVLRRLNELSSLDSVEPAGAGVPGQDPGPNRGMTREEQGDLDQKSLKLTEEEVARGEWLASHSVDPIDDFVVVLLEIVGSPTKSPHGDDAVFRSLALVLGSYLEDLRQDGIKLVLDQLTELEAGGRIPRGTLEKVFGKAATSEHLGRMIAAASAAAPEVAAGVQRFLSHVLPSIYPALLETLSTSTDKAVRKMVLGLLDTGGGAPLQYLWPLMQDARWYVVRNAVQLATASGDPEVVPHLEPLLRHSDIRVRREVARSLAMLSDGRCLTLLVRAIQDEDSGVRILAARGLARQGGSGQFLAVQAQVESREFETRSSEEAEAFLVAYAALGGETTVEALNKIWKRKMFSTSPLPLRLAAVIALGAAGGAKAQQGLAEAMESGEPQIQRAAARAMGEAQALAKGADL